MKRARARFALISLPKHPRRSDPFSSLTQILKARCRSGTRSGTKSNRHFGEPPAALKRR